MAKSVLSPRIRESRTTHNITTSKLLFFFPKHTGQIEHHTAVKKRKERASIVRRMFGNSNIVVELHVV